MNFFENQIPSSQITPLSLSDEPSSTMTTGSRSSASDSREIGIKKKSKDEGHLIVRTEIGRSAPKVETTWMEYTAGSRCRDKVGHGALPMQAIGGGK